MAKWAFTILCGVALAAPVPAQDTPTVPDRLPRGVRASALPNLLKPLDLPYAVRKVRDVAYRDDEKADKNRHKLDLYIPVGPKEFPVFFFVHGGAWRSGSKDLYGRIGELFAGNGIGTVIINYRLSGRNSKVRHPDHIHDVARAFAWTYANIKKYGGRPDMIFAAGHSAGGHLVALLATDENYLKAEQLTLKALRGVIPMSGVYTVLPDALFQSVFGDDPKERQAAFPITHLAEGKKYPPFLVIYADKDLPTIDFMSERFYRALKDYHCECKMMEVSDRNHITLIMGAMVPTDPVTTAVINFIRDHSKSKEEPTEDK